MANFVTPDLNGGKFKSNTPLTLSTAVVLWAWSNSCNSWLRQSEAITLEGALAFSLKVNAECPESRIAFTPCLPA